MGKARRQYNHRISHTACRTPPSLLSQQSCVQSTGLCWTCPSWVPPNSPKPQRWALSPHPFYRCCHRGLGKRGPRLRIPTQHRAQPRWQPRPVLSSPRHHCPSEGAWDPALVLRSLGRRRGSGPRARGALVVGWGHLAFFTRAPAGGCRGCGGAVGGQSATPLTFYDVLPGKASLRLCSEKQDNSVCDVASGFGENVYDAMLGKKK